MDDVVYEDPERVRRDLDFQWDTIVETRWKELRELQGEVLGLLDLSSDPGYRRAVSEVLVMIDQRLSQVQSHGKIS